MAGRPGLGIGMRGDGVGDAGWQAGWNPRNRHGPGRPAMAAWPLVLVLVLLVVLVLPVLLVLLVLPQSASQCQRGMPAYDVYITVISIIRVEEGDLPAVV